MGLGVPENIARGAGFNKGVQDKSMRGIFGTGGELAIGEGAGTAQTKLDIALAVELAGLFKVGYGL